MAKSECNELRSDSLNSDFLEVTEDIGVCDTTIRPTPDWLLKALGLPPYGPPQSASPPEPPKDNPPA